MPPSPENLTEEAAEEAAWAEVLGAWEDEARHRAYLARLRDLDALAVAGRRYREVLAARPGDPIAARFRDEIVKRAMVQGLAQVPRSAPPRAIPRRWARVLSLLAAGAVAAAAFWAFTRLRAFFGAAP